MFDCIRDRIQCNGYYPDTILDIGAHKGSWTDECLKIFPKSTYHLFEPIPYDELKRYKNVYNVILNEEDKMVDWFEGRDTGDSIFQEISHEYYNVKPQERQSRKLDNILDASSFQNILIKIDCQGAEIPILKGATNVLQKTDFVILEIPLFGEYNKNVPRFIDHINFMDSIGFIPFDMIPPHYINKFSMQVDMFFIKKTHRFNEFVKNRLKFRYPENIKKVAFLSNKLTLRGTEIALYDYADYNERILCNESIIITRDYDLIKHEYDVDKQAYDKFHSRFKVEYYSNNHDIDNVVMKHGITHLYIIKAGDSWDGILSSKCKNLIHCVFTTQTPHGQVYSPISQVINNIYNTNFPVVPHMAHLPDTNEHLRNELNIPDNAIVFGRYGGKESFDIQFVHDVIKNILTVRDDIYFLFMNTNKFYEHKNIIYLDGNSCMIHKRKFINTCDALIHARDRGETFGLTCGEFAICKKPVITYGVAKENSHLMILKDKAVVYNNELELFNIMNTFHKDKYDMTDNGYMFYNPENVMNIFKKVFLS